MPPARAPRTRDAAESMFRLKRLLWSLSAGIAGAMVGVYFRSALLGLILAPICVALSYVISGVLVEGAARGMQVFYAPSGSSTPASRGWSREEALVLQDRAAEAATLYEAATFDDPGDPEPFLRLARLHRDHLGKPGEAVRWYRVARETTRITRPQALAAAVELVELCRREHRLAEAEPELRWIVAHFPGTPSGDLSRLDLEAVHTEERRNGGERRKATD